MDTERERTAAGGQPTVPLRPAEPPPPRRRRLPAGAVAALVVLLLALLAVGRLGGLHLWPSFPNPFATRQVECSKPVLLKAIVDLKVYKAASGNFQLLVDVEKGSPVLPRFVKGERTLFVAAGTVDAEVDFSSLDKGAIRVSPDGRSVTVTLSHARLGAPRIDPDRSYVASRQRGVLDRLGSFVADDPNSQQELYR